MGLFDAHAIPRCTLPFASVPRELRTRLASTTTARGPAMPSGSTYRPAVMSPASRRDTVAVVGRVMPSRQLTEWFRSTPSRPAGVHLRRGGHQRANIDQGVSQHCPTAGDHHEGSYQEQDRAPETYARLSMHSESLSPAAQLRKRMKKLAHSGTASSLMRTHQCKPAARPDETPASALAEPARPRAPSSSSWTTIPPTRCRGIGRTPCQ